MKRILLCFVFAPALGFAQSLGTKADIQTKSTVPDQPLVQPMDMIQMVAALLIVGGLLKWALPKAMAKFGKRLTTPIGSTIRIEESASFGGGQLQIVSVRDRTLLLCVTAQGVSCLTDLTQAVPDNSPVPEAFIDILDRANPVAPLVIAADEEVALENGMSMEDALSLIAQARTRLIPDSQEPNPLDRLNRLTGSP